MLAGLLADHPGRTHCYYLERAVRGDPGPARHQAHRGRGHERQLREWYRPLDVLPGGVETVIPAASPLEETVEQVLRESGLWVGGSSTGRTLSA